MFFENNIKFCRKEKGLTQEQLGNKLGVDRSTVTGWENGYDSIPLKRLIEFCNLYNYSVDFVLGISNDKKFYYNKINTNKEKIAQKLKIIRTNLKFTKKELAEDCNIDRTTYGLYENGRYIINTITLYIICVKYKVSADWILGRNNEMYI